MATHIMSHCVRLSALQAHQMPTSKKTSFAQGSRGLQLGSSRATSVSPAPPTASSDSGLAFSGSGAPAIAEWLETVAAGLGRYEQCFAAAGFTTIDDVRKYAPPRVELTALLSKAGAGRPQVGRISVAVAKLRFPEARVGLDALVEWLDRVSPGYSIFAEPMFAGGYHSLHDLCELGPTAADLEDVMAVAGAEPPHVAMVSSAVVALKRQPLSVQVTASQAPAAQRNPIATVHPREATSADGEAAAPVAAVQPSSELGPRVPDDTARPTSRPTSAIGYRPSPLSTPTLARHSLSATSTPSLLPMFTEGKHAMLSYQWDHQSQVLEVRRLLESLGVPCWIDVDRMVRSLLPRSKSGHAVVPCLCRL
jgi:hypothetical protein